MYHISSSLVDSLQIALVLGNLCLKNNNERGLGRIEMAASEEAIKQAGGCILGVLIA
jgi:hypothetical protein